MDDLAKACVYFMKRKTKHTLINIGSWQRLLYKILCKSDFKINYAK